MPTGGCGLMGHFPAHPRGRAGPTKWEDEGTMREDRRRSERRAGISDPDRAPGRVERRSGRDRRQAAAALVVLGLAATVAPPAESQQRRVSSSSAPTAGSGANPLSGAAWYVDPASNAKRQADAWRSTRPRDAAQMDKMAAIGGQAEWFGDWNADIIAAVDRTVTKVTAAGALPVLVAYNIPNRDCDQHSGGGAADAPEYRSWIRGFALGIAGRRALVVVEPDALGHVSQCGTEAQKRERMYLIWDAVQVLKADPTTLVYVDIGHSGWLSPEVAADRLRTAGVDTADGFATNVSNFNPTANEASYGQRISSLLGGKHFVVDTSRNGRGPASGWCNPQGEALGAPPTASTGLAGVDAFLWVKRPGESDGACNGGPNAGTWWADYALGLAQRAAF